MKKAVIAWTVIFDPFVECGQPVNGWGKANARVVWPSEFSLIDNL